MGLIVLLVSGFPPPTVFRGKDITISIGDIMSESFVIKTDLGDVFMNVGFQKGEVAWM